MKNVMIILAELSMLVMMIGAPSIALEGARCGLTLWAHTVLPGIFPASLLGSLLLNRINVPDRLEKMYIIIFGMLTGFPCAAILYSHYAVRHPDDTSMSATLAYCNISSPSFLLNYIYGFEVMQSVPESVLLVIVYGSSLIGLGGGLLWGIISKLTITNHFSFFHIKKICMKIKREVSNKNNSQTLHVIVSEDKSDNRLKKYKVLSYMNTCIKSCIKCICKSIVLKAFRPADVSIKREIPKNEQRQPATVRHKHTNNISTNTLNSSNNTDSKPKQITNNAGIMESCCLSMIKTCGYIVLFAALSEYLLYFSEKLFTMSANLFTISVNPSIRNTLTGIFCGLIEITTGINVLCNQTNLDNKYSLDSSSAFLSSQDCILQDTILQDTILQDNIIVLMILMINSLGGLSTLFQTISAAGDTFNIKKYIHHKLIYCMITACVYVVCSHIIY